MKPATVKGQYVKAITVSTTMGLGFKISRNELQALMNK